MILFLILCVFHFISIFFFHENPILLITKILPIFYLIYFMVKKIGIGSSTNKFIFAGLIFSLFGDTFLAFPQFFIPGLGSFLIGQILYSIGFSKEGKLYPIRFLPFLIPGSALYLYLIPVLPSDLLVPVTIYFLALVIMAWRSASRDISKVSLRMSIAGASIFLVSDGLIALTKFRSLDIPYPDFLIMVTYYFAQYMLIYSNEKK